MQRRRNYNNSTERFKYYLHSIPKLLLLKEKAKYSINEDKVVKSNVLYSIPSDFQSSTYNSTNAIWWRSPHCRTSCVEIGPAPAKTFMMAYSRIARWSKRLCKLASLVLLFGLLSVLHNVLYSNSCYAATTASLSLSNNAMISEAVVPGSVATTSTNVTVSVSDAESYSLTLKVNSTTITNGSTGTNNTLTAGNVVSDNTWGYKWDNASTYTAPTTTGTILTSSTNPSSNETKLNSTNGSTSFTKTLTFGAKFGSSANAGTYHGSGTISLVATPRDIGKWSNGTASGIQYMQDIKTGTSTDSFCKNTLPNHASITLKDKRDDSEYTIVKMADGKCWMTDNLKLMGDNLKEAISSSNSQGTPATGWTMPSSSVSGFSDNTASNAYLGKDDRNKDTGYYTWCAATAGTCSSATSNGAVASASICPKGWKLPTGGRTYTAGSTSEFYNLILNGIFKDNSNISTYKNNVASQHYFSDSNAVNTLKGSPYNFAFTGYVYNGSYNAPASYQYGYWWSSTANGSTYAYYLAIYSSSVYPGTGDNNRYVGFAVRCVAQ